MATIREDRHGPPGRRRHRADPVVCAHATGAVFAGRFSPEKGAVDAIAIARRAGMAIDLYGDAYDGGYAEREVLAAERPARCARPSCGSEGERSGGSSPAPRPCSALRAGTSRSAWLPLRRRRAPPRWSRIGAAGSRTSSSTESRASLSLPEILMPRPRRSAASASSIAPAAADTRRRTSTSRQCWTPTSARTAASSRRRLATTHG